jgi:hypothetical protein
VPIEQVEADLKVREGFARVVRLRWNGDERTTQERSASPRRHWNLRSNVGAPVAVDDGVTPVVAAVRLVTVTEDDDAEGVTVAAWSSTRAGIEPPSVTATCTVVWRPPAVTETACVLPIVPVSRTTPFSTRTPTPSMSTVASAGTIASATALVVARDLELDVTTLVEVVEVVPIEGVSGVFRRAKNVPTPIMANAANAKMGAHRRAFSGCTSVRETPPVVRAD